MANHSWWSRGSLLAIALGVVLLDQLTKLWVRAVLPVGISIPLGGIVSITHVRNAGIAFGLAAPPFFLVIVTTTLVIALLVLGLRLRHFPSKLFMAGLGLILGGAAGNLVDRLRLGYVTDFIDLRVWPIFNVADSAVVVGVGLLAFFYIFLSRPGPQRG